MTKTSKAKVVKRKLKAKLVRKTAKVRKPAVKASAKKASVKNLPIKNTEKLSLPGKPVGKVTHFYDQISVAVVALNSALKVDDKIKIGRGEPFFEQAVKSMQVDHKPILTAKRGQEIGLKVRKRVRENDLVFKI